MRRTSVSLPTKHAARDPFEKPDRYGDQQQHLTARSVSSIKAFWMSQGQVSRWLKATAILALVLFFFYYLSPDTVDIVKHDCMFFRAHHDHRRITTDRIVA